MVGLSYVILMQGTHLADSATFLPGFQGLKSIAGTLGPAINI